jgi:hypothetical protein
MPELSLPGQLAAGDKAVGSTPRCHAETDGRRVDLHRLAAFPHGLPLRVGATLSLAERGGDIAALAVELRSWIVQPDPGQRDLLDSGFAHLRQAGPRSAPPCPFTSGSAVPRASR